VSKTGFQSFGIGARGFFRYASHLLSPSRRSCERGLDGPAPDNSCLGSDMDVRRRSVITSTRDAYCLTVVAFVAYYAAWTQVTGNQAPESEAILITEGIIANARAHD
jgi:hypothetical protein